MERAWGSLGTEDRVRAHGTGIFSISFAPKLWENRLTIQPFRLLKSGWPRGDLSSGTQGYALASRVESGVWGRPMPASVLAE